MVETTRRRAIEDAASGLFRHQGYAATSGDRWMRPELALEAIRLSRLLAEIVPREPEAHGLVALMEYTAARFGARPAADGTPILLADQDWTRWDWSGAKARRAACSSSTSTIDPTPPRHC